MTEIFNIYGNSFCLKEVTRRKQAKCKYCNKTIQKGDRAIIMLCDTGLWSGGVVPDMFDNAHIVGVFHTECVQEFEIECNFNPQLKEKVKEILKNHD